MPGLFLLDDENVDGIANEESGEQVSKEDFNQRISPRSHFSGQSPHSDSFDLDIDAVVDTSIEQLYHNVCQMQSSDESPSRRSFGSYGTESRIDSELCHLAGDVEIRKDVTVENEEQKTVSQPVPGNSQVATTKGSNKKIASPISVSSARSNRSLRSSPRSKFSQAGRGQVNTLRKSGVPNPVKKQRNSVSGRPRLLESGADNIDSGASLLKQARDLISSGDNLHRALELALRAKKSFEKSQDGKNDLDMVMCLHVLAAIYCNLSQHDNAIPILERAIEIPTMDEGENHALAKFAGCMQLGDIYAMLGQIENSVLFYSAGLEIQRQVLGENDPRVGETFRYVAEAHVQALQFDEAEKLCLMALDINKENGSPASLEEAANRRLMGLICESKGEHEAALENYVLASSAMASNGREIDKASVDCSIGDTYLSLARYDEAIFAYRKALAAFKSARGENHPTVASIYVRLADLNNKIGKFNECKSYCESALRIYGKPIPGIPLEEFASGLVDVSAIYESVNNLEMALKLLQKALKTYTRISGHQSTIAGIEAQVGVLHYMMGNYAASYKSFKNSILKFRASGEKKSALFGVALNQMGLVCVQRYAIDEAAELFEEARDVLEKESGPYHPDTLGVYSNLAGTYDAMGRLDDAIEILEYVVEMREEKLGTANPEVDDEKRRLAELLREAGRVRIRKSRPLENFLT